MSLGHGRHYLAIPGPSVVPDRVLQAMHQAAPNIYTGALVETVQEISEDLCAVARTKAQVAMYIANGHGVWEAAMANLIVPGDKILVLVTGRFGAGWAEVARRLRGDVEVMDFGLRSPVDLIRVEERLRADRNHEIRAVLVVQVDTATSVLNDIPGIRKAMDAAGHPALLGVDCIACLAVDRMEMDDWGVDIVLAASQKGLMTPPGMAFAFISDKAMAASKRLDLVSPYWDWNLRANPAEFYQRFNGTAPTHHLFGLRAALDMIKEEGLEAVWARHEKLARAVWEAFEHWGAGGPAELNIADRAHRAHAVTSVRIGAPKGEELREWVMTKAGVTLGLGIGMVAPDDPARHGFFRVGHMGHVNAHMVLGLLGVVEAGMQALDIPFGEGALSAAAKVCAEA